MSAHQWTSRLAHIDQRTPIELRASDLGWAIEKMGGHPLLTEAQQHVQAALCMLGAWTDAGEPGKNSACYEPSHGDEAHEHYVAKAKGTHP
jgi:hypothetical protein